MKHYIVFDDGRIGYIKNVCTCDACKQRNQAEMFINDLEGKYLDCIKTNEVSDIIYVGDSICEAINHLVKYYEGRLETQTKGLKYLQCLIDFYSNQLIKN